MSIRHKIIYLIIIFPALLLLFHFYQPQQSSDLNSVTLDIQYHPDVQKIVSWAPTVIPRRYALFMEEMNLLKKSCQIAARLNKKPIHSPGGRSRAQVSSPEIQIKLLTNEELVPILQNENRARTLSQFVNYHRSRLEETLPTQNTIDKFFIINDWGFQDPHNLRDNILSEFSELTWLIQNQHYSECASKISLLSRSGEK